MKYWAAAAAALTSLTEKDSDAELLPLSVSTSAPASDTRAVASSARRRSLVELK